MKIYPTNVFPAENKTNSPRTTSVYVSCSTLRSLIDWGCGIIISIIITDLFIVDNLR